MGIVLLACRRGTFSTRSSFLILVPLFALLLVLASRSFVLTHFGAPYNDSTLGHCDDCGTWINISGSGIRFFGEEYEYLSIGSNGILSFVDSHEIGNPDNFNPFNPPRRSPLPAFGHRVICPHWEDQDLRLPTCEGGTLTPCNEVYFRIEKEPAVLSDLVASSLPFSFIPEPPWVLPPVPDLALFVTYYKVMAFNGQDNWLNTYQVLLLQYHGDNNLTLAVFNYEDVEWYRFTDPAVVGFSSVLPGQHYEIPGISGDPEGVFRFETWSSCGTPGQYVFRIDSDRVNPDYCWEFNCSEVNYCSSHGICDSDQHCVCHEGYYSDNCSLIFDHCGLQCYDFGVCPQNESTCQCADYWKGENCSEFFCDQECSLENDMTCFGPDDCRGNCSLVHYCNWHGWCINGVCECDDGYYADNCSQTYDHCVPECYDHGLCLESGGCRCVEFWEGDNCTQFSCHSSCKYTKECIGPNDCRLFDCANLSWCYSHGDCIADGQCRCHDGHHGDNCSQVYDHCGPHCYDHGWCPHNETICRCDDYWKGENCSQFFCDPLCESDNKNLRCSAPNECGKCLQEWFPSSHESTIDDDGCFATVGRFGPEFGDSEFVASPSNETNFTSLTESGFRFRVFGKDVNLSSALRIEMTTSHHVLFATESSETEFMLFCGTSLEEEWFEVSENSLYVRVTRSPSELAVFEEVADVSESRDPSFSASQALLITYAVYGSWRFVHWFQLILLVDELTMKTLLIYNYDRDSVYYSYLDDVTCPLGFRHNNRVFRFFSRKVPRDFDHPRPAILFRGTCGINGRYIFRIDSAEDSDIDWCNYEPYDCYLQSDCSGHGSCIGFGRCNCTTKGYEVLPDCHAGWLQPPSEDDKNAPDHEKGRYALDTLYTMIGVTVGVFAGVTLLAMLVVSLVCVIETFCCRDKLRSEEAMDEELKE